MKSTIYVLPAIGASLVAGCAGPLAQRWDDPVYRSLQQRYTEYDQQSVDVEKNEPRALSFGLDSLQVLHVDDAIRLAIDHSPRLRSAGYHVDAASGRVLQAGLYPNPSINFEAEALGSDEGSAGETAYVFEQEIVLGNKLNRARDVADSDRLAAREEFVAEEFAVAARVSRAYFAGVAAHQRLVNREELASLASQLFEAASAKVEAGSATVPDQLRAQVVYEQAQMELDTARYQEAAARQVLASTIGLDSPIELTLASPLDDLPILPSRDEILEATLQANSRVSIARVAIDRARHAHKLAKAQGVPDLIASIGPRYSDIDGETTVDVGLGIEIPLFDRNQGEVQAALAERLSASAQLKSVQLELLGEISQAWTIYESAFSAAIRYQDRLLPMAEKTLGLTQQAYKSGKADYLRLLDAQQVVIESRIAYINTLEQLHTSAALLNQLSHTNTPWRNPRIENQHQAEVNQE